MQFSWLKQAGGLEPARTLADVCVLLVLAGGISSSEPPANPVSWLSDKSWGELVRLSADVKGFEGLEQAFRDDPVAFKVACFGLFRSCRLPNQRACSWL
jgi:hypothetical protein